MLATVMGSVGETLGVGTVAQTCMAWYKEGARLDLTGRDITRHDRTCPDSTRHDIGHDCWTRLLDTTGHDWTRLDWTRRAMPGLAVTRQD